MSEHIHYLFRRAWTIVQQQYLLLIGIALVMVIFFAIGGAVAGWSFTSATDNAAYFNAMADPRQPTLYVTTIVLLLSIIIQTIGTIALTIVARRHTQRFTPSQLLGEAMSLFWRFIGLGIFLVLIAVAALAVAYLPTILLAVIIYLISPDAFDVAFEILQFIPIIASLVYTFFFIFAPFLLIDRERGLMQALRESRQLIRGRWWHVFWRVIIFYVLSLLVSLVLSYIPAVGAIIAVLIILPANMVYLAALLESTTPLSLPTKRPA